MEAWSYSQTNHCQIHYFTELIWNKPLTSGRKGTISVCFLWVVPRWHSTFHHWLCSALDVLRLCRSAGKCDWLVMSHGGVTANTLGNSLLDGCERCLAVLSALSSPFILRDVRSLYQEIPPPPHKILSHWLTWLSNFYLNWIIASYIALTHLPRALETSSQTIVSYVDVLIGSVKVHKTTHLKIN